jgi:hypothetical protein
MDAETDSVEQNCNTDWLVVKKLLISYKRKEASQLEAQTQRSKRQLAASFALPNKMHKDQFVLLQQVFSLHQEYDN